MTEQVMVVPTERVAPYLVERGLVRERTDEILDLIVDEHFFIDRPVAEESPQYKQIIPYVVIRHGDRFYLLQRTKKQTESRLHLKHSIGIGGHINPDTPDLIDGLHKELEEEVAVEGDYDLTFAGILIDTTNEVSNVHLGLVYILDAATDDVTVRETEKMTGRWATADDVAAVYESLESWSQIVWDSSVWRRPPSAAE
jgi:predicted NUDIX family phosphoesterase